MSRTCRSVWVSALCLLVGCGPSLVGERKRSSLSPELDPADVTSMTLTTPQPTFCASSGKPPPLRLLVEHGGSEPLIYEDGIVGEARQQLAFKSSAGSFDGLVFRPPADGTLLTEPITLEVSLVAKPSIAAALTLTPSYACDATVASIVPFSSGAHGPKGSEQALDGGNGGRGQPGPSGKPRPPVVVDVGEVDGGAHGPLMKVRVVSGSEELTTYAATPHRVTVSVRGQRGGDGGAGGDGGRGYKGTTCENIGRGGDGGAGAPGGDGGPGPSVTVRHDAKRRDLLERLVIDNRGGDGGKGGAGGRGGLGGDYPPACNGLAGWAPPPNGVAGPAGANGRPGPNGPRPRFTAVKTSELFSSRAHDPR